MGSVTLYQPRSDYFQDLSQKPPIAVVFSHLIFHFLSVAFPCKISDTGNQSKIRTETLNCTKPKIFIVSSSVTKPNETTAQESCKYYLHVFSL